MVQIGDNHASINVQPCGHVDKFSNCVKMNLPSLSSPDRPMGSAMIVATMRIKFYLKKSVVEVVVTVICFSCFGEETHQSDGERLHLIHDFGHSGSQ